MQAAGVPHQDSIDPSNIFKLAHNKRSNLEPICMMQLWFCQSKQCGLFPSWASLAAKLGLQAGVLPGFNSSLQDFQASSQQRDQTYNPSEFLTCDKLLSRLALCDERSSLSWSIQSSTLGHARIQSGLDLEEVMRQVSWRELWYQKQTFNVTFILYLLL